MGAVGVVVVWGGGCWVCFGWQGAVRVDVFGLLRHGVGLAAGGLCGVEFRGLGFRGLGLRVITSACAHARTHARTYARACARAYARAYMSEWPPCLRLSSAEVTNGPWP